MKSDINLSIIIVNWNGVKFLPDCLKSIVENPPRVPFEIVVIDNASSDGSVAWFHSAAKTLLGETNFRLIESRENLGFGRANNQVIAQTDSPYVFLLNPDTLVKPGAIDRLLETLQADGQTGAVAPKLYNPDGTHQFNVWKFPTTALGLLFDGLKLSKIVPSRYVGNWLYSVHWDYRRRTKVPMFSGAAIMAKRAMIEQVGAFNPDFHMFGEDCEWCVRIGRGGWNLVFEPEAAIVHFGGLSSAQLWNSVNTRIKEEEGFLRFQEHCLSPFQLARNTLARIFILQFYRLKRIIKRQDNEYLDRVILMQKHSLKTALKRLFSMRQDKYLSS